MSILIGFLYVLEVIVCFLLGGIILLQKPKDGGLNTMLGGSGMGEALFGAQVGNVLVKATIVLGTIFLLNTLVLSKLTSHVGSTSMMEGASSPPAQTQPMNFPGPDM